MTDQIKKILVNDLGLTALPADKKNQLLMKMTEVVLRRIFLETMEKLNDRDQDAYAKMIDENVEPAQLESFLKDKISDYEGMVGKIVADFVTEMKAVE